MRLSRRTGATLLMILVVAAALRFTHLDWGLPDASHNYPFWPDESTQLLALGEMNPAKLDFIAESWAPRLGTGLLWPYGAALAAAHAAGFLEIHTSVEWYRRNPGMLGRLYLIGRLLVAVSGLLAVALVFWAGRTAYGEGAALWAAALLAVSPGHVQGSHFFLLDVPANALLLLSTGCLLLYIRSGPDLRWLAFAAAATAYGTATKLTAAPLWGGPLLAPLLAARDLRSSWRRLLAHAAIALLLLLLLTPLFHPGLLHLSGYASDARKISGLSRSAYQSLELLWSTGRSVAWWGLGPIAGFLVVAGVFTALLRRRRADILLLVLCLPLAIIYLAMGWDQITRWTMLFPFFRLLAAAPGSSARGARRGFLGAAMTLSLLQSGLWSAAWTLDLGRPPLQAESKAWILDNIPRGAKIGVAQRYYLPQISSPDYDVIPYTGPRAEESFDSAAYFLVSDFDRDGCLARLSDFRLLKTWWRSPSILGIRYDPPVPMTARYSFPTIYLYERASSGEPGRAHVEGGEGEEMR